MERRNNNNTTPPRPYNLYSTLSSREFDEFFKNLASICRKMVRQASVIIKDSNSLIPINLLLSRKVGDPNNSLPSFSKRKTILYYWIAFFNLSSIIAADRIASLPVLVSFCVSLSLGKNRHLFWTSLPMPSANPGMGRRRYFSNNPS